NAVRLLHDQRRERRAVLAALAFRMVSRLPRRCGVRAHAALERPDAIRLSDEAALCPIFRHPSEPSRWTPKIATLLTHPSPSGRHRCTNFAVATHRALPESPGHRPRTSTTPRRGANSP